DYYCQLYDTSTNVLF
nr:immunoglobulin light chain junction region [Macaca mulatta]